MRPKSRKIFWKFMLNPSFFSLLAMCFFKATGCLFYLSKSTQNKHQMYASRIWMLFTLDAYFLTTPIKGVQKNVAISPLDRRR